MIRIIPVNANKCLVRLSLCTRNASHAATTAPGGAASHHSNDHFDVTSAHPRIGKREIVGFGIKGEPQYFDQGDYPCPSIRWKEDTPELLALKQKESGDWKNLSVAEKKELYRASFRSTFAEFTAPNNNWKFTVGMVLGMLGFSLLSYNFLFKNFIYNYPKPGTHSHEYQAKVLERMIAQGQGRIDGVSSEWDYEHGDWKKNVKK